MKNLIIIGAGGFGREVYQWARQSREFENEWVIKGFLDENLNALDNYNYDVKIINKLSLYIPEDNDLFICAIGDPKIKENICRSIIARGGIFTNIIHPSVVIGGNVHIGVGVVLCPYVVLTSDIFIGDFVAINIASSVGHDAVIEDWCTISAHCDITGFTKLFESTFLGSHAVIIPKAIVGKGGRVGAGSVVLRRVKPDETVFGVPARPL